MTKKNENIKNEEVKIEETTVEEEQVVDVDETEIEEEMKKTSFIKDTANYIKSHKKQIVKTIGIGVVFGLGMLVGRKQVDASDDDFIPAIDQDSEPLRIEDSKPIDVEASEEEVTE